MNKPNYKPEPLTIGMIDNFIKKYERNPLNKQPVFIGSIGAAINNKIEDRALKLLTNEQQ